MSISESQVIYPQLPKEGIQKAIDTAKLISGDIIDRVDLHGRDYLERFVNCLMGEVAEAVVLDWLQRQGKNCRPATDKLNLSPDPGHDLVFRGRDGEILGSIKSSLSVFHSDMEKILDTYTLATTDAELRSST